MNRLIIIGASGHGKVVADIAKRNGYTDIVFLDDDKEIIECGDYPVIGNTKNAPNGDLFIAIGNAFTRLKLWDRFKGRTFPTLIHPDAVIADGVKIGDGTVVMAGVVINPGVRIGNSCIINTSSSIDHDCTIGNYSHISVGTHLCGTVLVGDYSWIGAGATVSNNVSICSKVTIGAGAVVVKNIEEQGTYIGVPARKMEKP